MCWSLSYLNKVAGFRQSSPCRKWNENYESSFSSAKEPTAMVIMFENFFMFDQMFLSSQVKRSVIISNGKYELPCNFPNCLQ